MSGWQTALDNKLDAIEWITDPEAKNIIAVQEEVLREKHGDEEAEIYRQIILGAERNLRRAVPMYVHPDIVDIAEIASESFQPEPLHESDLITEWCFMSLPR